MMCKDESRKDQRREMQESIPRLSLQDHLDESGSSSRSSRSSSSSESVDVHHPVRGMKVTLLCRKSDGSILYMEAGKDFVDLLISFMALPIGSVMKMIREMEPSSPSKAAVGGIFNIYQSISDMDDSLLYVDKQPLLSPKPEANTCLLQMGVAGLQDATTKHVYYKCCNHGCLRFVIDVPGQICPVCKFAMSHKLELIYPKASYPPSPVTPRGKQRSGYVRKNRAFIITDGLEILPLSGISSVILLSKLNLDSIKDLESIQVSVGVSEVLELLKASLSSQTALNDVFRAKKN